MYVSVTATLDCTRLSALHAGLGLGVGLEFRVRIRVTVWDWVRVRPPTALQ
jgi:hypothetical protein